jgi:peptide/nickel transport system ATP-binding protein
MKNNDIVLDVRDLFVEFQMKHSTVYPVNGVSYYVRKGEIVGFVGESGSGKSVTQLSSMRLLSQPQGKIVNGSINLEGTDVATLKNNGTEIRNIRGSKISMIFQEPMSSLNPVLTVGEQIVESIIIHQNVTKKEAYEKAVELMELVRIPDARERLSNYPHQFSGGMCQRIMIAIAMSCNPDILIADEATTALDVTIQAQILELLRDIVRKTNTSLIIITHNLGIVARYADRIYVMYGGSVVENGSVYDIFKRPSHPYTVGLLNSIPSLSDPKDRELVPIEGSTSVITSPLQGCPFYARCTQRIKECAEMNSIPKPVEVGDGHFVSCINKNVEKKHLVGGNRVIDNKQNAPAIIEVKDLKMYFPLFSGGVVKKKIGENKALSGINLSIRKGSSIGLVGESGCGKTTLAKCIMRLYKPTDGEILFNGKDIAKLPEKDLKEIRKKIQFVFQDPYGSLNPRKKIGYIIGQPLINNHLVKTKEEYNARVDELFRIVSLDPSMKDRYPHELSGGQRQRVGIARALASNPEVLVCDEPVSALDVSIQAQVLNILERLQTELGLTIIFIAHDLSVVRHVCDTIAVMYLGRIVEYGNWDSICSNAQHPYTQMLFSAIPIPDPDADRQRDFKLLQGEIPSVLNVPSGCNFHTRCPYATEQCAKEVPKLRTIGKDHEFACFLKGGK